MNGETVNCENGLLKVASRESKLALIQTNCVIGCMKEIFKKKDFEVVTMTTKGDQILDKPLPQIGGKSLFTRELEDALEERKVDFAVHSLKDLPTSLPPGLAIGAILKREDPRDALVLHPKHSGTTLETLPEGSVIGTSSLRRSAQLRRMYPKLVVKDIRGNLPTRLRKLDQGLFDGILLAVAGVERLGLNDRISQILSEDEMLYAVGQGALAVECRRNDCQLFCQLSHTPTVLMVVAERSLLCRLEAGCSAPIAVATYLRPSTEMLGDSEKKRKSNGAVNETSTTTKKMKTDDDKGEAPTAEAKEEGGTECNELVLTAAVWSLDGAKVIKETSTVVLPPIGSTTTLPGNVCNDGGGDDAESLFCGLSLEGLDRGQVVAAQKLGESLAQTLLDLGAGEVISQAKETTDRARGQ